MRTRSLSKMKREQVYGGSPSSGLAQPLLVECAQGENWEVWAWKEVGMVNGETPARNVEARKCCRRKRKEGFETGRGLIVLLHATSFASQDSRLCAVQYCKVVQYSTDVE